jgi:hypothetical protein
VTSAEDGSVAIGLPSEEYAERNPLQIMGKLKASAMRCVRTYGPEILMDAYLVRTCAAETLGGYYVVK